MSSLLDPGFVRELEHLRLEVRRRVAGARSGEHRSLRRGASVEFAEHRAYVPGDDLRRVDWNAYARLGELVVRLFVADEDVTLHLFVDASRSMAFGEPSKLDVARRLAAALGYLALTGSERVSLRVGSAGRVTPFAPMRGRRQLPELLSALEGLRADGVARIDHAVDAVLARGARPGIAVVLSDLMDDGYAAQAAQRLAVARNETSVVHVLCADEIDPGEVGESSLTDSETGERLDIMVDDTVREAYRARLGQWVAGLDATLRQRGVRYVRAFSGRDPFGALVEVLTGRAAWNS